MQSYSSSFFLDHDVVCEIGKRTREITKGHLCLLGGESDSNLRVAALMDGKTIDFLFGASSMESGPTAAKANAAKKFLRKLDESGQEAVASFYFVVYKSMADYQQKSDHPCSCCWARAHRVHLQNSIEDAFTCLKGMITDRNIINDE
jgi:hypothetical protein